MFVSSYLCEKCREYVSLNSPLCSCANQLPDFRRNSVANTDHIQVYEKIGKDDLEKSFQPQEEKELRADQDFRRLSQFLSGKNNLQILEIGPGDGLLAKKLSANHKVFVIDITSDYITNQDYASGAFLSEVETMPFIAEFDLVVMCDVLEHVLNEGDAMLSIRKSLKPDGFLYVRCPANEPLVSYSRYLGSQYPYVHLRTYSKSSIKRTALHAGFRNIRCGYVRAGAAGFARRTFGLRSLQRSRAQRHTIDVARANEDLGSSEPNGRLDWLVTKMEALTWIIGWRISRRITDQVLQRVWYKPSEVYLIGQVVASSAEAFQKQSF
jgi:SAM-dependent methyltransferase